MKNNYDTAFAKIIGVEGGMTNDPNDSGGLTKYGISQKAYPDKDIANLTLEHAKDIYKRDYWDKVKCDLLSSPLDLFCFDAAVNQGTDAAIKLLQKTLGVAQDGILGVDTLSKAQRAGPDAWAAYMANRAVRYMGTRSADKYLHGWLKRLFVMSMP